MLYKLITLSSTAKFLYDKQIASDIKQCKEIENITQRQGEDNTTECLLDFEYIKNHYRLIRVYLSR